MKCVQGSPEDFDANWDAMIADFESNGLAECEAGYTAWLAEKLQ